MNKNLRILNEIFRDVWYNSESYDQAFNKRLIEKGMIKLKPVFYKVN